VAQRSLPDDAHLVRRLRDRDEVAFTQVVDAWSPGMIRLARSFVTTDASAQEVVQDAWIAVITGIAAFEGRSSLRTWVYRILVNTAKRRGERESHVVPWSSWAPDDGERHRPTVEPSRFQGPAEPYPGHWREFPQEWPSPETEALAAEIRSTVGAAVQELPARQRIVITLRDVEGYTADEVCVILDISAANQRVLLHRARGAVRAKLEEYFATMSGTPGSPERWCRERPGLQ
jgi:RNA polymerase sigma-70 factor (ECF subfamily)